MKKNITFFNKLLYFINSIFAFVLIVSYIIPYVKPTVLGSFAGLGLLTPVFIMINIFFLMYWLIGLNRTFLLSLFVLAIGFAYLPRLYKIKGKKELLADDVKVMSYNVRMHNKFNWIKSDSIKQKINQLVESKSPDILCVQEYSENKTIEEAFKYKFIKYSGKKKSFGHAIFSKFPLINQGSIDFKESANRIVFSDIIIEKDTVRLYNIHFQSLRINPKEENFGEEDANKLRDRISNVFQKQQGQVELFLLHQKAVDYPIIVAGDFNNTAFSWLYRRVLKGKKDAYVEAGKGFDKTYDFPFPTRIDYIFVDKSIKVNHFKAYRDKLSDHFPVLARLDRESIKSRD